MKVQKGIAGRYTALWLCGVCFLAGGLAGCLAAAAAGPESRSAILDYLEGYGLVLSGGAGSPSWPRLLWSAGKWHLLVALMGFTSLGVALIPAGFAARGFVLSCCTGLLVRTLAGRGAVAALVLFGPENLLCLPALFILGCLSWQEARGLHGLFYRRSAEPPRGRGYYPRVILCFALTFLAALSERMALPPLLRAIVPFLTGA